MKNITPRQYAQSLFDVFITQPEKVEVVVTNFLRLLVAHRDLKKFPEILRILENIFVTSGVSSDVTLTTAHTISDSSLQEYETVLREFLQSFSLKTAVDTSLSGGVKLRINDRVYDGSIKQHLNSLLYTLSS